MHRIFTPGALRPGRLPLHLRRLAVAPHLTVTSSDPEHVVASVDGLVCPVCAARTESALRATPGIRDARVDLRAGTAIIQLVPGTDVGALQKPMRQALERVVIGMTVRRIIERIMRMLATSRRTRAEERNI